jgi:anti-sigma-K factor RskA
VVHEPAAAFALDALDRDEAAEFEQHLAICPNCEDELARLRVAAVALAFAIDQPVPRPELRLRVLDTGAPVVPFRRRRRPQLVTVAAALAACAALAIVLQPWDDGRSLGGMRGYEARGARATLLVDGSGDAVLAVRPLPRPPAGKGYEVWVIAAGDKPIPAGWVRGPLTTLTRPVSRGAAVAVSIEPLAGSRRPTGPLLLRAETT